jgi:putative transposase
MLLTMPRAIRIEYEGAIYHIMNRGDHREDIFRDDADRTRFLETLAEACSKTGWQVHAYCLMRNHFHLVIETPGANLVAGMKWLLGVYTIRYNVRHKLVGHLFAGRYKALPVSNSGNGYLRTVCDYVHLNPVRANLVPRKHALEYFAWSSYGEYLKAPGMRAPWLRVDRVFGEKRIPKDSVAGRREFARLMELRRADESEEDYHAIQQGWCLGDEAFRKELLAAVKEKSGHPAGAQRRAGDEQRAEEIISAGLVELGWTARDLTTSRKGEPGKVRLARRLRQETTLPLKWIAHRLSMGTWKSVSNLLRVKSEQ